MSDYTSLKSKETTDQKFTIHTAVIEKITNQENHKKYDYNDFKYNNIYEENGELKGCFFI